MHPCIIIRRRTTRAMARLRDSRRRSRIRAESYRAAIWFGMTPEAAARLVLDIV